MIVADTHVWFGMNDEPSRLSDKALTARSYADGVLVAPTSAGEVAALVRRGRLTRGRPAME